MTEICPHKYMPYREDGGPGYDWCHREPTDEEVGKPHPCPYAHEVRNGHGQRMGFGCDNANVVSPVNQRSKYGTLHEFGPKAYCENYDEHIARPVNLPPETPKDVPVPGFFTRLWSAVWKKTRATPIA